MLKLKDGVTLKRVVVCRQGQEVVIASSTGRLLRLAVNDSNLPLMGRTAQGPMLMRLLPGETIVGAAEVSAQASVLMASQLGQIKRLDVSQLRTCLRGDLGQIGLQFQQRSDVLVDLQSDHGLVVGVRLTPGDHNLRLATAELNLEGPATTGLQLRLPNGQTLHELVPLITTA